MSWIVAGIAAVGAVASSASGNRADKEAAAYEKFQNQIDVERFKGEAALAQYNMTRELGQLESEQVAVAAAMGKQSNGGSVANIQEVGRADLADNMARIDSEVARAEKYGKVTDSAIDKGVSMGNKQRNIKTGTVGLLSFAKAFA